MMLLGRGRSYSESQEEMSDGSDNAKHVKWECIFIVAHVIVAWSRDQQPRVGPGGAVEIVPDLSLIHI